MICRDTVCGAGVGVRSVHGLRPVPMERQQKDSWCRVRGVEERSGLAKGLERLPGQGATSLNKGKESLEKLFLDSKRG